MGFRIVFDTESEVPDSLKSAVSEQDGNFVVSNLPDGLELAADTSGLKNAIESERARFEKADKVLRGFGDITPTQAKQAVAKVKEFDAKGPQDGKAAIQTAVAEREAQLIEEFDREKKTLIEDRDRWKGQHVRGLLESAADTAIETHKGNKKLLRPVVMESLGIVEENGTPQVVVLKEDGKTPRIGGVKDGASVNMTPIELVKELKDREDLAPAFAGTGNSGTGAAGGGAGGGGGGNAALMKLTPSQRLRELRKEK